MILKEDNIELRKFEYSYAEQMAELANNLKISQNLRDGFPHPYTLNDAKVFISKFIEQEPVTIFAIFSEEKYVGNIGLSIGQDVYRKSAEIGYFLGEPYWNKGIATKAVNMITKYGFKKLSVVRIYTGIYEYNQASMRVLEKCGFEKDCVFKKAIFKKNQIWDEHRYSKINPIFSD